MGKVVDAAIGRIEAAEKLDGSGYLLGKAIPRTGQVAGRPSKRLANVLHVSGGRLAMTAAATKPC